MSLNDHGRVVAGVCFYPLFHHYTGDPGLQDTFNGSYVPAVITVAIMQVRSEQKH